MWLHKDFLVHKIVFCYLSLLSLFLQLWAAQLIDCETVSLCVHVSKRERKDKEEFWDSFLDLIRTKHLALMFSDTF